MTMSAASAAPFRPLALGPYRSLAERRDDGGWLLRAPEPLGPYERRVTARLVHWAAERPGTSFLVKRDASGAWQHLRYADALEQVRHIAQALLDRGLSAERPLMILSGNDFEHELLALAAQHVGVPYVPVSPAYSLVATDAARLRHAVELTTPGLVFAGDGGAFARAIGLAVPPGTELCLTRGEVPERRHTPFDSLQRTPPTPAVERAHDAVDRRTIAKFLFTSGSTKQPKAVTTTHGMLCSNQQMLLQCWPFLQEEPPLLVDWLPWHHTASGNKILGLTLHHGGTLHIDDGKPTDTGMAETLRNLREISPTLYFTVPRGLEALAQAMRGDAVLRESFFRRLRLIFPAGAGLPRPVQDAIQELAVQTVGHRIPMTTGLGMTETAPFAISAHVPDWQAGVIGVPAPGVEVKLAPVGDKLEVRYRGPNVMPGYWRQPELAVESFDDEGFFRSGDAARFVDESNPSGGLRFDGRIAEDFKLGSGTWVNVGQLRMQVIAAGAPYVHDVVLTGHDRDSLGMIVFLLPAAASLSSRLAPDAPAHELASDPQVRAWAQSLLDSLAARATGSSNRIDHGLLADVPPSVAAGEITDKGSINQRAVLKARAAAVEALHAASPGPAVLVAQRSKAR
jgi:feruloyl-CoA synthase